MSTTTLVVIVLRLFTIYLIVEGISQFALCIPMLWEIQKQAPDGPGLSILYSAGMSVFGMLFIALILYLSAFRFSSLITKGHEVQLSFANLSKEDLYAFAFVFLGIIFTLLSIYPVVQTGYKFFAFDFSESESSPQKGRYLWPLLGSLFQLIAGLLCVFRAQTWAKKLIRLDETKPPSIGDN